MSHAPNIAGRTVWLRSVCDDTRQNPRSGSTAEGSGVRAGGGLQIPEYSSRRINLIVRMLALAAVAGLLIGYIVDTLPRLPIASQPDLPSMSQCVTDTLGLFCSKDSSHLGDHA